MSIQRSMSDGSDAASARRPVRWDEAPRAGGHRPGRCRGSTPCSRHVVSKLCTMPTCSAPTLLHQNNWLFGGSLRSGQRAATTTSLIQCAKLNGHEPFGYLKDMLERLPTQKTSQLYELLPHHWQKPPDHAPAVVPGRLPWIRFWPTCPFSTPCKPQRRPPTQHQLRGEIEQRG